MRLFLPIAFAVLATGGFATKASAQIPELGVRVRIGIGVSPDFDTASGSKTLTGPELAASFPVRSFLGQTVYLEPSYFGGGRLIHGSDADADIFRLALLVRKDFLGYGLRAGVGFAHSESARGGEFGSTDGAFFDVGVEFPFTQGPRAVYGDLHAIIATQSRLSGIYAGVGFKL